MRNSRSWDGIKAVVPQNVEGILKLPPISFPIPITEILAARQPPSPPELPPHDFFVFQGFFASPQRKF